VKYGLGYHRDAPHKRTQRDAKQLLVHRYASSRLSLAHAEDLRPFEDEMLNQLEFQACTGHGTSQGISIVDKTQGLGLGFTASPIGIYTPGRALGRGGDPSVRLSDTGAMPADVMAAIAQFGVRPMGPRNPNGNTDCTAENINAEPTLDELETDAKALVVGEYRINELDHDVCDQVAAVISDKRVPVGVGTYVDTAFSNWRAGDLPMGLANQSDPNGGGHWMVIVGYFTDPATRKRIFIVCNSWGEGWGDRGHIYVTEGWIKSAWDLYALTARRPS
jgi:hypothetical protein